VFLLKLFVTTTAGHQRGHPPLQAQLITTPIMNMDPFATLDEGLDGIRIASDKQLPPLEEGIPTEII